MTRLFDEDSGAVTPVTVIEAGPCPVVAVRTPDADGGFSWEKTDLVPGLKRHFH